MTTTNYLKSENIQLIYSLDEDAPKIIARYSKIKSEEDLANKIISDFRLAKERFFSDLVNHHQKFLSQKYIREELANIKQDRHIRACLTGGPARIQLNDHDIVKYLYSYKCRGPFSKVKIIEDLRQVEGKYKYRILSEKKGNQSKVNKTRR